VFIAAPLFSQAEREFNLKLDEFLRKNGFNTILPQRDVGDLWKLMKKRGKKAYRDIYERDLGKLEEADVIVAILNGPDVDSGTAFEVGYACAKRKPVVGLKTDVRMFARDEELNNMLAQGVGSIARNFEELVRVLKTTKIP
jgi:nucleoside 2-deoxyribosyltransferase